MTRTGAVNYNRTRRQPFVTRGDPVRRPMGQYPNASNEAVNAEKDHRQWEWYRLRSNR
jgi:hypothetical protein